jgi:tetratricopeptide (TPR) repeat protein
MKRLILALLLVATCGVTTAVAQEIGPEWGENDSQEVRRERRILMNALRDEIGRGNLGVAVEYLQTLIRDVPRSNPNLYRMGMDLYKKKVGSATDAAQKAVMADSLLLMHDLFLENFGAQFPDMVGSIWNNKAAYTRDYFGDDRKRVTEAFRQAADNAGKMAPSLVTSYFIELTRNYTDEMMPVEEYLAEYDRLDAMLAEADAKEARGVLEKAFIGSGAADCDNLERLFGAQIEADPENAELLDKTMALLNRGDCKGDFYVTVAEKYYKVKPTAMTARIIAQAYKTKGDNATAARFIQEALRLATDPGDKADLLVGLAADDLSGNNFRQAYSNAQQAASIDGQNAVASYIMGVALAGGAGNACSDAFHQRAAYWLAYDKMQEARRLANANPGSVTPEMMKDIDGSIARFAATFPDAQEIFLQTLDEGAPYNVNCGWITGRTTVRRRP